ncbi:hypothetical protein GCM10011492_43380 [Flexivirga endophytica]|uniref:Uncharacterized protein n=1 Tax=Flexivirga endophytica TaxID=1849103 RepID=A0A916TLM9_9MICO|nr:hypothetical protein [Flexivirga endophytica]GGB47515.1 hypothetical protein GCM10011492_43380 [Flexivirga endophytica]GHB66977.1 hypothetical protein GCM10008112_39790 [Flexivirga endophytica]
MDIQVGTVWRAAVITAVGGTVAALSGALIAGAGNDISRGYVMRVAVLTVVVLATVVILAGRSVRLGQRHTFAGSVMLGSAIGFLLDPATWGGRAYVAQVVLGSGLLAAVVDLLLLLVLTGALTVTLGARLVRPEASRSLHANSYVSEGYRS